MDNKFSDLMDKVGSIVNNGFTNQLICAKQIVTALYVAGFNDISIFRGFYGKDIKVVIKHNNTMNFITVIDDKNITQLYFKNLIYKDNLSLSETIEIIKQLK